MKKILILVTLFALIFAGCQKDITISNNNQEIKDFSTWNEENLDNFLNEVLEYSKKIDLLTYETKEEIVTRYEKYFSPELSKQIVDSKFIKTDKGWVVPDGDAGYIFVVPQNDENSDVIIEFGKEIISLKVTYKIGMYSSIEYVIEYKDKPIITKWVQK